MRWIAFFVAGLLTAQDPDVPLREAVQRGDVPGVVAMVATPDSITYHGAFGKRDVRAGVPMTEDTIFAIYSMTKPVTSVAVMQLVEQGKLTLDEPVKKYLPAVGNAQVLLGFRNGQPILKPPAKPITLRHLLTHTSGYGYGLWDANLLRWEQQHRRAPGMPSDGGPLVFEPGAKWEYGTNVDCIGRLIEAVTKQSLDQYFRVHILLPLGMKDTFFNVPPEKASRLASSHRRAGGRLIEEARQAPARVSSYSGGGGLYSTAADYVRFMQMILNGGSVGGTRILRDSTVAEMIRNQIGDLPAGVLKTTAPDISRNVDFHPGHSDRFGFGFLINPEGYEGGRSAGSLAWAGLANTFFWIDPQRKLCAVMLLQVLPFCDEPSVALLGRFERAVYKTP
jgi:CubicO group peptidase (beta-lactamase class C family)